MTSEPLTEDQLAYIEAYKDAVLEIFESIKEEMGYEGDLDVVVKLPDEEED